MSDLKELKSIRLSLLETPAVEQNLRNKASYGGVPDYMVDGLVRYVLHAIDPGGFLTAILANDGWITVFRRADDQNMKHLKNWAMLLYNDLPSCCWGSEKEVQDWLDTR